MTETEAERRLRVLSDEVDRLKGMVDRHEQPVNTAGPVPDAVKFAALFVDMHLKTLMPISIPCGFDEAEIVIRNPTVDELMAFGAACELLRDWFDANNPKRKKVAASKKKATK